MTEESDATARLVDERDLLDAVIENSPVATLVLTADGDRTLRLNQRARDMFGVDFDPTLGRAGYWDLIRDEHGMPVPFHELAASRALRGETATKEELIVSNAGTVLPVMVTAGPVRNARGEVVAAVVLFQDITERKKLARVRDEWNAIVAHDLRQPISTLALIVHTLAHRPEISSPQVKKLLSHAQSSVQRLSRMVSDLLDVSKIEASRLTLDLRALDAASFVRSAVERFQLPHPDSAIRVVVDDPGSSWIRADPERLEQALTNLLSNAVKYGAPRQEVVVELKTVEDRARIAVTNKGSGLEPAETSRLFERFERLERRGAGGSGLGLYITKGIIDAHGGRIWVESEPGKYATFVLELPTSVSPP